MSEAVLSLGVLRELQRQFAPAPDRPPESLAPLGSPFGMRMRESSAFPFNCPCSKCGGSGEGGEESTYCRECKGAGAVRLEGVMMGEPGDFHQGLLRGPFSGASTILITSPLPRKFEPRFPFALPERPLPRNHLAFAHD